MLPVDELRLSFDSNGLFVLNGALAFIMFGVALDLTIEDFRQLLRDPRAPAVGLVAQFLVLPALAWPLALLVAPTPSMALGMMLVAACPGGNVSNVITQLGGGRVSVS
ncbi:MAG: bile acid:sodium symporter family protein, partial [Myxococcota bacterium]